MFNLPKDLTDTWFPKLACSVFRAQGIRPFVIPQHLLPFCSKKSW